MQRKYEQTQSSNNLSINSLNKKQSKATVIGAGPVGLCVGIELAEKGFHVKMIEGRPTYTLKHKLKITLKDIRNEKIKERLTEVVKPQNGSITIQHDVLCQTLSKYAKELNIEIINQQIESKEDLQKLTADSEYVIAADGSHSKTREFVFGKDEEIMTEKHKQRLIMLKYKVKSDTRPLSWMTEFPSKREVKHLCFENIENDQVTLVFFIDKETNEKLDKLESLTIPQLPESLRDSINLWLKKRKEKTNEAVIEDTFKLSKTTLSSCRSESLYKKEADHHYFLAGDAAYVIPFDRSASFGMRCTAALAKDIYQYHISEKDSAAEKSLAQGYSYYVWSRSLSEFTSAKFKSYGLNALKFFTQPLAPVSSSVIANTDTLETSFDANSLIDEVMKLKSIIMNHEYSAGPHAMLKDISFENKKLPKSLVEIVLDINNITPSAGKQPSDADIITTSKLCFEKLVNWEASTDYLTRSPKTKSVLNKIKNTEFYKQFEEQIPQKIYGKYFVKS